MQYISSQFLCKTTKIFKKEKKKKTIKKATSSSRTSQETFFLFIKFLPPPPYSALNPTSFSPIKLNTQNQFNCIEPYNSLLAPTQTYPVVNGGRKKLLQKPIPEKPTETK